jgi:type I restriction enzyme S subunit
MSWYGELPKHWNVFSLKTVLREHSVKNQPSLPLLSVERERGVIARKIGNNAENHNVIPEDLSGYKVVAENQFVMNKMKAWQGSYGVSKYNGIVSPAYFVFDLDFTNTDFFNLALRSKAYIGEFARYSKGIRVAQWDCDISRLRDIQFADPPLDEQEQIARFLDWKVSQINQYIIKVFGKSTVDPKDLDRYPKSQIALLIEYRTRLISDVVTGKLNVRDVVVPEYDMTDAAVDEELPEDTELNEEDSENG